MSSAGQTRKLTHRDLAELRPTKRPFTRAGWAFELKYDGFRTLATREKGEIHLVTRRGTDLVDCFPEIGACLILLPPCVIDGELVVLDDKGRPQFERLCWRFRLKRERAILEAVKSEPAVLFAFDLLELRGRDMRRQPYTRRKGLLEDVLEGSTRIRYLTYIGEEGERLFNAAEQLGLEGIVAKPLDSPYYRGRDSGWLKIKTSHGRRIDEERAKWNDGH